MNGGRRRFEPAPKNYVVVSQGDPNALKKAAPGHHRLAADRVSGELKLEITVTANGLHAGSGLYSLDGQGKPFRDMTLMGGQASIPGTGIKGAIRTIVEALTGSCADGCRADRPGAGLCFACRVFGAMGYLGSVGFDEALIREGDPDLGLAHVPVGWPPRKTRVQGRRLYGDAPPNLRQQQVVAVVPGQSRFDTALRFTQVTREELGVVLLALGLDGTFRPKLGGGKYAGLGAVRFSPKSLSLRQPRSYRGWDERGAGEEESMDAFVSKCIEQGLASLPPSGKNALKTIRSTLK